MTGGGASFYIPGELLYNENVTKKIRICSVIKLFPLSICITENHLYRSIYYIPYKEGNGGGGWKGARGVHR